MWIKTGWGVRMGGKAQRNGSVLGPGRRRGRAGGEWAADVAEEGAFGAPKWAVAAA